MILRYHVTLTMLQLTHKKLNEYGNMQFIFIKHHSCILKLQKLKFTVFSNKYIITFVDGFCGWTEFCSF